MRCKSSKNTGQPSQSIEMFATFLAQNGGVEREKRGESILFAAASPVRTSVTQAGESASPANDRDCGASLPGSFAFFDRNTSSWKMCQRSRYEALIAYSETWPASGLMRNGIVSRLAPLVPRISAGESSFLPTPRASDVSKGSANGNRDDLPGALARLFPTPTSRDWKSGSASEETLAKNSRPLNEIVAAMYPTPRADGLDNCGGSSSRRIAKANGTYIGRTLNTQFVEWLMGFPIGWTDCDALATQ